MKILLIPAYVKTSGLKKLKETLFSEINSELAIDHIIKQYKQIEKTIIIVNNNDSWIENIIINRKLPIEVVKIEKSNNILDTIRLGLEQFLKDKCFDINNIWCYINFCDIINKQIDDYPSKNQCYLMSIKDLKTSKNYTLVSLKNNQPHFYDKKNTVEQSEYEFLNIIIGNFYINAKYLINKDFINNYEFYNSEIEPLYLIVKYLFEKQDLNFIKTNSFYDLGDSFSKEKSIQIIQPRFFNEISIDTFKGLLTKRSKDISKFNDEINWYLNVPKNLKYLTPRVISYELGKNPFITMEFYNYKTAHSLLINDELNNEQWSMFFKNLKKTIDSMKGYTVNISSIDYSSIIYEMYINKTKNRLNNFKIQTKYLDLNKTIIINQKPIGDLNSIISQVEKLYNFLFKTENKTLSFIHGDLCFSNILVETDKMFFRFIDPRGSFGNKGIYGDVYYEIAKIQHSINGKYDYIIEDMFEVSCCNNQIEYKVNGQTDNIKKLFYTYFENDFNMQKVKFIEAMLFLSMCPLHADYPLRQLAMFATGCDLLLELTNEIHI